MSKDLWRFYKYHAESLQLSNEQVLQLKHDLGAITTYITQTLETIAQSHRAAQTLFNTTEALLDEAKAEVLKLNTDLTAVKDALKKIQALELSLIKINELANELSAKIALAEQIKQDIQALVPNILNEVKANLLADKEQYERELEAKKDEYITLIDEKLSTLDEKIQAFESDYLEKQRVMEQALAKLREFIATLDAQKIEFRTSFEIYLRELQAACDTHEQSLQDFTQEKQEQLESFKGQKQEQLQQFKDQKLQAITTHTTQELNRLENASQNCKNEIRVFSEDFLREVNAFNSAAILELRELYYAIATNTQQLGNGYQSKSFTASGDFTLVDGVRDYFVFVRGGTGGSHNGNAGGISSFGSYVSANGGAGNSGGAGQRGESKAQFVYIKDQSVQSVRVSVASGGVVIVSWAKDLEAKVDTSFLSAQDLAILSSSSDTQAQQAWLKANITTTKQENYYRQLVGLSITTAPITAQNLARILDENDTPKYKTLRHLELALAKTYLDTGESINAQILRIIDSVASYTIEVAPERTSLEVGTEQVLTITTQASDYSYTLTSAHCSFEKTSATLRAQSAGECVLELSVQDDLKSQTIRKPLRVEVVEPTPPEPEPEPTPPESGGENGGESENGGGESENGVENGQTTPEPPVTPTPDNGDEPNFTDEELALTMLNRARYEDLKEFMVEWGALNGQNDEAQIKAGLYQQTRQAITQAQGKYPYPTLRAMDFDTLKSAVKWIENMYALMGMTQADGTNPFAWHEEVPTLVGRGDYQQATYDKLNPMLLKYFVLPMKSKEDYIYNHFLTSLGDLSASSPANSAMTTEYYIAYTYIDAQYFRTELASVDITKFNTYPYTAYLTQQPSYATKTEDEKRELCYFYLAQIIMSSAMNPNPSQNKKTREQIVAEIKAIKTEDEKLAELGATILAQTTASKAQWQAQSGQGFDALRVFLVEHHDYSNMGNGIKDSAKAQQVLRAYTAMLGQAGIGDDSGANALVAAGA